MLIMFANYVATTFFMLFVYCRMQKGASGDGETYEIASL